MPNWKQAASGLPSLGMGLATGNPLQIAQGALGTLGGIFGEDPEEERQRRFDQLRQQLIQEKSAAMKNIGTAGTGQQAVAREAAARQAAAGGTNDVAARSLPAVSNIANSTSQNMDQTGRFYDRQISNATADFENRPIEPSTGDYLMQGGAAAIDMKQNQDYIDALKGAYGVKGDASKVNTGNISAPQNPINTTPMADTGGVAPSPISAGIQPEQNRFNLDSLNPVKQRSSLYRNFQSPLAIGNASKRINSYF